MAHGRLSINVLFSQVKWQNEVVNLTVTEFWLVKSLTDRIGQVKSRDELCEAANTIVQDNTITANIRRIRNKFLAVDKDFDQIETVPAYGYRWKKKHSYYVD